MKMTTFFYLCVLVHIFFSIFVASFAIQIEDIFHICPPQDIALLNECVKENVNRLKPYLKTGIPELSIPSFTEITASGEFFTSNVEFVRVKFYDLHISGLEQFEILNLRIDPENDKFYLNVRYRTLHAKFKFQYEKKLVFFFTLDGDGSTTGKYSEIYVHLDIVGFRNRNQRNLTYFHVKRDRLNLDFSRTSSNTKITLHSSSYFSFIVEEIWNSHWKSMLNRMKYGLEEHIGEAARKIYLAIFNQIPFEVYLPSWKGA